MAPKRSIFTRIQLKNDTEENWNKAVNFVPLDGEVIIYDTDENHEKPRIKIGDGVTVVNDLPFMTAESNYLVENTTLILG